MKAKFLVLAAVLCAASSALADDAVKMKPMAQPATKGGGNAARQRATEGQMKLGEKTYKVKLVSTLDDGDFRGKEQDDSGVQILIDRNANGKFDPKGESFDVRKPFNVGGTTYELKDISKDGTNFKVAKSTKTVAEVPMEDQAASGPKAASFEAKTTDNKTVKFPDDYKGKVVMLDFWATWCGPCMREVPNVVANYDKYHSKGFEVLGVTLDDKNGLAKVKSVMSEKHMKWPQIFDGGGWQAKVAQLYDIHSIPAAFLVDGDTGKIIAKGDDVRGPGLEKAIEKALEAKKH
jgi:thiol-disulfide isomerase/thioredoxin